MGFSLGGAFKGLARIAAPVAGFALGGPAGAALGGALAGSIGKKGNVLKNAAGGALSGLATGGAGGLARQVGASILTSGIGGGGAPSADGPYAALGASPPGGGSFGNFVQDERARGQGFDQNYAADRDRYLSTLGNGQQALNTYAQGAMNSAMPSLYAALNTARGSAIQRGVQNGELSTSSEGDIFSAFQHNLANSVAGQSMNLYGTQAAGYGHMADQSAQLGESSRDRYGEGISADLDRKQQQRNNKTSTTNSLLGAGASILGAYMGSRNRGGSPS